MSITTLDELFVSSLMDIYYAEKQILKALPAMVRRADRKDLKIALETHRQETEAQVERIETVFELMDLSPRSRQCDAVDGLLSEAKEQMDEIKDEKVLDAGVIGSAQAVGHYEISRYGTLIAWAKALGRADIAGLLQQSLDQEKSADRLLSQIAIAQVGREAA
jgi:ferritin-like metal-binding protein YciE